MLKAVRTQAAAASAAAAEAKSSVGSGVNVAPSSEWLKATVLLRV